MDLLERVKRVRKELNLSRKEFAKKLGKTYRTIQDWELGNRNIPESALLLISKTFGVNYNWLKTGEGEMWAKEEEDFPRNEDELMVWVVRKTIETLRELGFDPTKEMVFNIASVAYKKILPMWQENKLKENKAENKIKEVIEVIKN